MSVVPVIRIMPSHPSQGDFVEINETDFDPAKHERYEPAPAASSEPPPAKSKLTLPPPPAARK